MHWQGGARASCLGAASRLDGLSLHVTLPYSEYGPGAPIKVMATFRNRGPGALALSFPVQAEATIRAEGKSRTYFPKDEAGPPSLGDGVLPSGVAGQPPASPGGSGAPESLVKRSGDPETPRVGRSTSGR